MSDGRRRLQGPDTPHVLRELSFVADGERGAILGPSGAVEWLCFPRWEDGAIFSSLVGGPGRYEVRPTERFVWGGHYEESTLIWRDRWVTGDGAVTECRSALALPGDPERAVLLRRVEALVGGCRVEVNVAPRPDYGRVPVRAWHRRTGGSFTASAGGVSMRMTGLEHARTAPDGHGGRMLHAELALAEGQCHDLVLELSPAPVDGDPPDPGAEWDRTAAQWKRRLPRLRPGGARRDAAHACAVLHGLTSSTGAMMAAATTSLPERADTGRDYDYRYAWIRDTAIAGQAMAVAAPEAEVLDAWTRFLVERVLADGPELAPAYTSAGRQVPAPQSFGLPGYPGGHDVAGNQIRDQFQLDALGEALLLFAAMGRQDRLDAEGWRAAEVAGDAIAARWRDPDNGFWELDRRWWTESRLACVAGLKAMAGVDGPGPLVRRWTSLADGLLAEVSRRCLHGDGRFQRADDDGRVDAAILVPMVRGALAPDDPRVCRTLAAVKRDLTEDGYVYRYRPDERPLGEAEGAFLFCGFLLSLAETAQGDHTAAARWFERTRASCGPPGLFSEEFDVGERQLRGNLPQAFVHALLLETAARQQESPLP